MSLCVLHKDGRQEAVRVRSLGLLETAKIKAIFDEVDHAVDMMAGRPKGWSKTLTAEARLQIAAAWSEKLIEEKLK